MITKFIKVNSAKKVENRTLISISIEVNEKKNAEFRKKNGWGFAKVLEVEFGDEIKMKILSDYDGKMVKYDFSLDELTMLEEFLLISQLEIDCFVYECGKGKYSFLEGLIDGDWEYDTSYNGLNGLIYPANTKISIINLVSMNDTDTFTIACIMSDGSHHAFKGLNKYDVAHKVEKLRNEVESANYISIFNEKDGMLIQNYIEIFINEFKKSTLNNEMEWADRILNIINTIYSSEKMLVQKQKFVWEWSEDFKPQNIYLCPNCNKLALDFKEGLCLYCYEKLPVKTFVVTLDSSFVRDTQILYVPTKLDADSMEKFTEDEAFCDVLNIDIKEGILNEDSYEELGIKKNISYGWVDGNGTEELFLGIKKARTIEEVKESYEYYHPSQLKVIEVK